MTEVVARVCFTEWVLASVSLPMKAIIFINVVVVFAFILVVAFNIVFVPNFPTGFVANAIIVVIVDVVAAVIYGDGLR